MTRRIQITGVALSVLAFALSGCNKEEDDGGGDSDVTVTYVDVFGVALPVTLLVHDAAGVLLLEVPGDASGTTTLEDFDAGNMVTTVQERDVVPLPLMRRIFTFVGVEPGDTLYAVGPFEGTVPTPPPPIGTVEFEAASLMPGQSSAYFGVDGCPAANAFVFGSGATASSPVEADCFQPDDLVPWVESYDVDGLLIGYAIGAPVTQAALLAGPVTLPAWSTTLASASLTVTGIPAAAAHLDASAYRVNAYGSTLSGGFLTVDAPAATEADDVQFIPFDTPFTEFQAGFRGDTFPPNNTGLRRRVAGLPASVTIDAATEIWPFLPVPVLAFSGSNLGISFSGAPADANELYAAAYWDSDGGSNEWLFRAAPDSVSPLVTPALPETLGRFRPTRSSGDVSGFVMWSDDGRTWDEVRNGFAPDPAGTEVSAGDLRSAQSYAVPITPP